MTHRERFRAWLDRRAADRVPFLDWWGIPHYREEEWRRQGLAAGADIYQWIGFDGADGAGTTELERPEVGDGYLYVPFRGHETVFLDTYARPAFAREVVEAGAGYRLEVEPSFGGVTRIVEPSADNPLGAVHGERYPVSALTDWALYRDRFQGADLGRYLYRCGEPQIDRCARTRFPVELKVPGPFGRLWATIGLYNSGGVLESLYDRPAFLAEMIDFWVAFACELARPALTRLKVDFATIEDGLAYDGGAFLSPDLLRRFIAPAYRRLTDFFHAGGVPVVFLNSGGSLNAFLPDLLDAGIGGITHVAVQAGMDLVHLKREYGADLHLIGGIDRRALTESDAAIEREVDRATAALEMSGVIPCLDASVLYGTPLARYRHYADCLARRLGVG